MTLTSRESEAQAASWDARLRSHDLTPEERERFAAWLKNDEQNAHSFDQLQTALATLRQAADHPQLRGLRESARIMERRSARIGRFGRAAIAASVVAMVGVSAFWISNRHAAVAVSSLQPQPHSSGIDSWSTGAGERRTLTLRDGSTVTMNAATRLEAEWFDNQRRLRLLAGQALFRVAKDPLRPFVVSAGSRVVTALGTTFDVQLRSEALRVTLLDGRVSVGPLQESKALPAVELTPSQEFEAVADRTPTVRRVDAVAEAAWADGQVIFTDNSLPDAVAEMNQYSPKQIVAAPDLARFRINGMFRAGNQDGFVAAVTSYYPIRAHEDSGRIILELRPDSPVQQ
ncbi:MAG: FecR domain-containing protein [Proteobacteria bacterium]|nr:FecR domain-containing protein [Pseudomonadota bacterium]